MNIRKTFAAVAAAGLLAAGLACGDEPAAAPPTATPKAWPTRDPGTVRETRTALATRNAVKLTRVPTPAVRPTRDPGDVRATRTALATREVVVATRSARATRTALPTREAYFATRDAWQTRNPVALPTRVPTRDARSSYRTRVADPSDVTGKGLGDPESVDDCLLVEHFIEIARDDGLTWDEITYELGVTADFLLRFREACLRSRSR